MKPELLPLMAISDAQRIGRERFLAALGAVWGAGLPMLQIREPGLDLDELREFTKAVLSCTPPGRLVLINRRPELTVELELAGVHIGGGDLQSVYEAREVVGSDRLVGYSAHRESELSLAAAAGADYVTFSPIFGALSKKHPLPSVGVGPLRKICARSPLSVYALGGVTPDHMEQLRAAGVAGVATIGAIWDSDQPAEQVGEFLRRWQTE